MRPVTSTLTMGPVVRRHALTRRSRWLAAVCGAAVLHIMLLAVILAVPHRVSTKDAEQPPQVVLLAEPAAAPSEVPRDTAEPEHAAPAAEPVMEPSSPPPPEPPPVAAVVESPPALPPPIAGEPFTEAVSPPLPESPPSAVLAEPPAAAAAHSKPPAGSAKPRASARSPSTVRKTVPLPSAAAPDQAAARQAADALEPYRNSLASHVRAFQKYPVLARARRQEGLVVIHIKVDRDGRIITTSVEQGSGSALLDQEALATLKRAEPMPMVPAVVPGAVVDLVFPLRFALE